MPADPNRPRNDGPVSSNTSKGAGPSPSLSGAASNRADDLVRAVDALLDGGHGPGARRRLDAPALRLALRRPLRVLAEHQGCRTRYHRREWLADRRDRRTRAARDAALLGSRPDPAARQRRERKGGPRLPMGSGIRCGTRTSSSTTACAPCRRHCRSPRRTSPRRWACSTPATSSATRNCRGC